MSQFTRQQQELLDKTELFVLDMDGTFYLGNRIFEGALDFLKAVEAAGKRYIFFTNNSSRNPQNYIDKLAGMDCHITRNQIMTSGDVMIQYLKTQEAGKSVYLLGTPALRDSFQDAGIPLFEDVPAHDEAFRIPEVHKRPDLVVVAFDQTLEYHRLTDACTYIREGAGFLATHPDINCPVEGGFIPDCGAFIAAISLSTGANPRIVGKPYAETPQMIADRTGIPVEKISFVGDRLYTDVACGVKNGAKGILVLSGETREEDLQTSEIHPDAVFPSIREMGELLCSRV